MRSIVHLRLKTAELQSMTSIATMVETSILTFRSSKRRFFFFPCKPFWLEFYFRFYLNSLQQYYSILMSHVCSFCGYGGVGYWCVSICLCIGPGKAPVDIIYSPGAQNPTPSPPLITYSILFRVIIVHCEIGMDIWLLYNYIPDCIDHPIPWIEE